MNAMKKLRYWMAAPVCFFAVQVLAGTIQSVKVVPATAPTGQQVKVTVEGEDEAICGLRVEYGNGDVDVTKMYQGRDNFPRSFMKSYSQPGTYTIIAKGGRDGSTFGCIGETKTTVVIVAAAPVEAPRVEAPRVEAAPARAEPPVQSKPARVIAPDSPRVFGRGARGG